MLASSANLYVPQGRRLFPLVGIGGLNISNAAEIIRIGADGVAVVCAIVAADDPQTAAEDLKKTIDEARKK